MTRTSRLLAIAVFGAAVAGLLAAPAARAQPRPAPAPNPAPIAIAGGGTDLLRAFLDRAEIQPVRANDNVQFDGELIVIVIGRTDNQAGWHNAMDSARRAIQGNGAVLIATDTRTGITEAGGWQQIALINGTSVTADPRDCYQPPDQPGQQRRDTPFVGPVSPDELKNPPEKPGRVWGLFRGLTKLATNDPTYFEEPQFRAEVQFPLARLPKSSATQWARRFDPPPLFAVGNDGPAPGWGGRIGYSFLAVADSSVYINQMIMEPGTDNLEFTLRTIEYLQGPDKQRKRCMFFENGRLVEKFDGLRSALVKPQPKIPPEKVPNIPTLIGKNQEKIVEGIDAFADRLQKDDWLHRSRLGQPGSPREQYTYSKWIEVAAVIASVFVVLYLLRRGLSARQPLDVPPPPNTGAGQASTGPPGVFDRRQKELMRRNNLYEPVRNLMREFFDGAGAPPHPGPRMPRLVIHRSVRKPDSLRQALRDMWRIAYGPPMHISAQRWFELEPYFERLRRAHEDGKWRFETDGT